MKEHLTMQEFFKLAIITPIYAPAVGGAATYYRELVDALLEHNQCTHVTIITEKHGRESKVDTEYEGRVRILRIFPGWAGRSTKDRLRGIKYGLQQIAYLKVLSEINKINPHAVLVHGSAHIRPNLVVPLLLARLKRVPIIADVRDTLIPVPRINQLRWYSKIIACSSSVVEHIAQDPYVAHKVVEIPAIQNKLHAPSKECRVLARKKYGLDAAAYWLYLGILKESKGIVRLIRIFSEAAKRQPDLQLVLAGPIRDAALVKREIANCSGNVRVLGSVPRPDATALIAEAALVVNCSPVESISRVALEAIDLRVPVGLPPNIREYERWAPDSIIWPSMSPKDAAHRLLEISASAIVPDYPIERHRGASVVGKYMEVLKGGG